MILLADIPHIASSLSLAYMYGPCAKVGTRDMTCLTYNEYINTFPIRYVISMLVIQDAMRLTLIVTTQVEAFLCFVDRFAFGSASLGKEIVLLRARILTHMVYGRLQQGFSWHPWSPYIHLKPSKSPELAVVIVRQFVHLNS